METTRARWASYASNRTAQKREQRRRQGERWRLADAHAQREALDRLLGVALAWRRWQAQE